MFYLNLIKGFYVLIKQKKNNKNNFISCGVILLSKPRDQDFIGDKGWAKLAPFILIFQKPTVATDKVSPKILFSKSNT